MSLHFSMLRTHSRCSSRLRWANASEMLQVALVIKDGNDKTPFLLGNSSIDASELVIFHCHVRGPGAAIVLQQFPVVLVGLRESSFIQVRLLVVPSVS